MVKVYLAYGSNLNIEQMSYRCPAASVLGPAKLKGYKLLFRGPDGGAVATVEKSDKGSVPVLLWYITEADERALDRYEGYPVLYRKETVNVIYRGKQIEAMVYIMNEGKTLGAPGRYYYNVIKSGYRSAGFDIPFLDKAVQYSSKKR